MPRQSLKKRADGRYRCKYKDQYFYGKTQSEALALREEYKRSEATGALLKERGITVRAYANKWFPIYKGHLDTRQYNALLIHAEKFCNMYGDERIADITATDIKAFFATYSGKSTSSIAKMHHTIAGLFRSATADRVIQYNPCLDVKPPDGTEGTHRAITSHERELIHQYQGKLRPAIMCMLYAGLRRGEVLALDVSKDVDFVNKSIHVSRAVSFDLQGNPSVGTTKTEAGERFVPLLDVLANELQGMQGLVIASDNGQLMHQSEFTTAWRRFIHELESVENGCKQKRWYGNRKCDDAENLPPWKTITIRPHDLRHSFCTMLHDNDIDLKTAMKWMGHADEKMTLKIYTHLTKEHEARAFTKLSEGVNEALRGQNGGQI